MHRTARELGSLFFEVYLGDAAGLIVDVGSYDRNGSLRSVAPPAYDYCGIDMEPGPGVDLCMQPDAPLPLGDAVADAIVCSSVFEHTESFWELFLDMERVLKPGGYLYVNAPSNGSFHRYPVDCWRFFPDAGRALQNWARGKGRQIMLVESFIAARRTGIWNDFVAVFQKLPAARIGADAFIHARMDARSIWRHDRAQILHPGENEEFELLTAATQRVAELETRNAQLRARIADLAARLGLDG